VAKSSVRSGNVMSRIGKKPVSLLKGVVVNINDGIVSITGPKGELSRILPFGIKVRVNDGSVYIDRQDNSRPSRAKHGLVRALIFNMVKGVSEGFERRLEINGVGYRAEVAGQKITLSLGYSHPIVYEFPQGISAKVDKNIIILGGYDRELLGEIAAKIRSFRSPEPYKGKGIKYMEETIRRKVGKTGAG
jgi:large subunit ribosomal protein L6